MVIEAADPPGALYLSPETQFSFLESSAHDFGLEFFSLHSLGQCLESPMAPPWLSDPNINDDPNSDPS